MHIAKEILKQRDDVDIIILIGQNGTAGACHAPQGWGENVSAETGTWVWIPTFRPDYSTKIGTCEDTGDSRPPVPVLETATYSVTPRAIP